MPDLSPSRIDVIGFKILINGRQIKYNDLVFAIEVYRRFYQVSIARIIINLPLGRTEKETFSVVDSKDFAPNQAIEIRLGSVDKQSSVFSGIITSVGIRNQSIRDNRIEMVVRCSDKAVMMKNGRKTAQYQNQKDSEIMQSIVSEYGLVADIDATDMVHAQVVNDQVSDWDFLVSRAKANGMLAYAEDGKVCVKKPVTVSSRPILRVDLSRDVPNFDFRGAQPQNIRGKVAFWGDARPKLNTLLELEDFGRFFSGNSLISNVHHRVDSKGWRTTIGIGLPAKWFHQ